MGRALAIAVLAGALVLGACGSSSKTLSASQARAADAEAKSAARTLQTEVEACFADAQNYAQCRDAQLRATVLHDAQLQGTGLQLGTGKGKVTVAAANPQGYTIRSVSKTGNTFTITRGGDGATNHTCHAVQQNGGCSGGRW